MVDRNCLRALFAAPLIWSAVATAAVAADSVYVCQNEGDSVTVVDTGAELKFPDAGLSLDLLQESDDGVRFFLTASGPGGETDQVSLIAVRPSASSVTMVAIVVDGDGVATEDSAECTHTKR